MNCTRILSLMLAAALQVMPLLRATLPLKLQPLAPSAWAIVLKLSAGSMALLGYHTVSGATAIVTPYTVNATATKAFSRQLGTSGQTAHSWSTTSAPLNSSSFPLTPGLSLSRGGLISGTPTQATNASFVITAWEFSNNTGRNMSVTFTFVITAGVSPPVITAPLQDQSVTAGANVTFSVSASGTPLFYLWQYNNVVITGATNAVLVLPNAQPTNSGTYRIIVSNSAGSATNSATLTVSGAPPSISVPPANRVAPAGADVSFAVTATGTAPLSYFWERNGTAIPGATNSTLVLAAVSPADDANYAVIVSSPYGLATNTATLEVVTPPVLTTQLSSKIIVAGSDVSLAFGVTGKRISYSWMLNNVPLVDATASALTLTNVIPAQSGFYSVMASNIAGVVSSATVQLLIVPPAGTTIPPRLSVTPTGPGQLALSMLTSPGYKYSLQYRDTLDGTNWTTLWSAPAAYTNGNIVLPLAQSSGPNRFYRAVVSD